MIVNCLSVSNPWSYLIASGIKPVENRLWTTKYRGRLYIHSSGHGFVGIPAAIIPKDMIKTDSWHWFHHSWLYPKYNIKTLGELQKIQKKVIHDNTYAMVTGCIIGYADLISIETDTNKLSDIQKPWAEKGQNYWIFDNAVLFENPIAPIKGRLRIFSYDIPEEKHEESKHG